VWTLRSPGLTFLSQPCFDKVPFHNLELFLINFNKVVRHHHRSYLTWFPFTDRVRDVLMVNMLVKQTGFDHYRSRFVVLGKHALFLQWHFPPRSTDQMLGVP